MTLLIKILAKNLAKLCIYMCTIMAIWRPASLTGLTLYQISLWLTHLGSEASIYIWYYTISNLKWKFIITKHIDYYLNFIMSFILFFRYWQLSVEINQTISNFAFQPNIQTTKNPQIGNISDVSGIWKHCKVSNAIRCSTLTCHDWYVYLNKKIA